MKVIGAGTAAESVVFTVDRGVKHKVGGEMKGNKYFDGRSAAGADAGAEGERVSAERTVQPGAGVGRRVGDSGAVPGEWVRSGEGDDGREGLIHDDRRKADEGG